MGDEERLLKDLEEFKKEFPNHPNPQQYPIQFNYFVKLFYYYRSRKNSDEYHLPVPN
jgi:hypothetical protein